MAEHPQPLAEPSETLSEREEIFEKWRKTVGLVLGPLAGLAIYLMDMPYPSPEAHTLAAILSWTVVWWICEPIPLAMTAIPLVLALFLPQYLPGLFTKNDTAALLSLAIIPTSLPPVVISLRSSLGKLDET